MKIATFMTKLCVMPIEVVLVHLFLGILLFFIINWIGKHSYSIGYMQISLFLKVEEAPAFNFIFKVFTPIVYLFILSASLYSMNLDKFVDRIYYVNIYYIAFRLAFNLVTNRGILLNWFQQFLYWTSIVGTSLVAYHKIIENRINILPDFSTISNELWIIILIFLFQVANNIRLSQEGTIKRKEKYLGNRYRHFRRKYGSVIEDAVKNDALKSIVYAILVYEDFNRPRVARFLERISHRLTNRPHSLGVMQVTSDRNISDAESVTLGVKKLVDAHTDCILRLKKRKEAEGELYFVEYSAFYDIIQSYNVGSSYYGEVSALASEIKDKFYPNSNDTLTAELESINEVMVTQTV